MACLCGPSIHARDSTVTDFNINSFECLYSMIPITCRLGGIPACVAGFPPRGDEKFPNRHTVFARRDDDKHLILRHLCNVFVRVNTLYHLGELSR